jgi:hypothetical protein
LAFVRRSAVSEQPTSSISLNWPPAVRFAEILFLPVSINSRFELPRFAADVRPWKLLRGDFVDEGFTRLKVHHPCKTNSPPLAPRLYSDEHSD